MEVVPSGEVMVGPVPAEMLSLDNTLMVLLVLPSSNENGPSSTAVISAEIGRSKGMNPMSAVLTALSSPNTRTS